jgi:hypothetical protein
VPPFIVVSGGLAVYVLFCVVWGRNQIAREIEPSP